MGLDDVGVVGYSQFVRVGIMRVYVRLDFEDVGVGGQKEDKVR